MRPIERKQRNFFHHKKIESIWNLGTIVGLSSSGFPLYRNEQKTKEKPLGGLKI